MSADQIIDKLNAQPAAVILSLAGRVIGLDVQARSLRMQFHIGMQLCHSVDVVQGGVVTAMLDASMAHAVLALDGLGTRVSTIDIHVSFLRPARAGRFVAVGSVVRSGRTIAFLKAELFDEVDELVATASSSAHLSRNGTA